MKLPDFILNLPIIRTAHAHLFPTAEDIDPREAWLAGSVRSWGGELALVSLAAMVGLVDYGGLKKPRLMTSKADFDAPSTIFWCGLLLQLCLVLARVIFTHRQHVRTRSRIFTPLSVWNETQPRLIRTLVAVKAPKTRRAPTDPAARQRILRGNAQVVLNEMMNTIKGVVPDNGRERYAANVMRVVPHTCIHGAFGTRVRAALRLEGAPPTWSSVQGVLLLDPHLSKALDHTGPDTMVSDFGLLLPHTGFADAKRWMPGAPMAYLKREMISVDHPRLLEQCEHPVGPLDREGRGRLEAYLKSDAGRLIRSFVSHPLLTDSQHAPKAVVNVHVDTRSLALSQLEHIELFYLLQTASLILLEILEELDELERSIGEWGTAA